MIQFKRSFLSFLSFLVTAQAYASFPLSTSYQIDNAWPSGYQASIRIKNNSSTPTSSWMATFNLEQGQSISTLWNGVFKANGSAITVTNPAWKGGEIIPAHGSTSFGFIVNNPQSTPAAISNLQAAANGDVIPPTPPVVLKAPVLQPINNPSQVNHYEISWHSVPKATGYVLQQSSDNNFSNPQTVFNGSTTSALINVAATGTYYYRVNAVAENSTSPFSNIVSTTVSQPTPPTPPAGESLIESYWESWNSADSLQNIVNMHVDIINIAFAKFASNGDHTYSITGVEADTQAIAQLVTLAHNAGKKVKVAVGGATYPIAPQLQTTQDAAGMAQAIATYIQQNNLDGVDLDIEDYPAPALQVALIQDLRQVLGSDKLISYTPKSPASTTFPYDQVIQSAHPYLDAILIMAYDYAPGYTYQEDVQNLIQMGVPASKISVGLMPGMDDVGVNTSLADITTAAQFIKQNGLEGIMFWDLNRDLENQTGLGASAATNTAWNVLHS